MSIKQSVTAMQLKKAVEQKNWALKTGFAEKKPEVLQAMARELRANCGAILTANLLDMERAQGTISTVMLDRLRLDEGRVEAMAQGVEAVALLPNPVGRKLSQKTREDGLLIEKITCPMGLIAIIYESRPNVTSDAAALAVMAGSACVLRAGKEAHASAQAIVDAMHRGLESLGISKNVITLLEDTSRESAKELMTAQKQVDLLIPRGGKGLISTCVMEATVPILETGTGICHGFVDESADQTQALQILENAKASRPSVCNALEVCLVHEAIASAFLPKLSHCFHENRKENSLQEVELRFSSACEEYLPESLRSGVSVEETLFDTEFLDYILAVHVVSSVEEAINHINSHSTGHSEVIMTTNQENAEKFALEVDSAAVYVNASTRFTDGGEFGLGCEMGISTQKLHARGPLGLEELCSFKFVITGTGQIRT